jgi:hypothetical protein
LKKKEEISHGQKKRTLTGFQPVKMKRKKPDQEQLSMKKESLRRGEKPKLPRMKQYLIEYQLLVDEKRQKGSKPEYQALREVHLIWKKAAQARQETLLVL